MTDIETFPLEILTEVLSNLPCNDLTQTARVSHKWHMVTQHLLYTSPCVTSISRLSDPLLREIEPRIDPPSLQLFLRTLLSPGGEVLAAKVRSLRLKWDHSDTEPLTHLLPNVATILTAAAASVASRIWLPLDLASQGDQVVLLLHFLPHLSILDVSLPVDSDSFSHYIRQYQGVEPGTADPLPLHQLCEFHSSQWLQEGIIDPKLLLILLVMPNMRTINVQILSMSFDLPPASSCTSSVTKLTLTRTMVSPLALARILNTTVALTHFSYFLISLDSSIDLSQIGAALAPLRRTLEVLEFTINKYSYKLSARDTVTGTLGSFRNWPRLHTLHCQLQALLGRRRRSYTPCLVDLLPARLRELEIVPQRHWSSVQERERVLPILRQKKTCAPLLERLAMALRTGEDDISLLDELRSACDEASVLLVDTGVCE